MCCRVEVFLYKNKSFTSLHKVNLPDPITQLTWLSDSLLCASDVSLLTVPIATDQPCRPAEHARWHARAPSALVATSASEATIFQGHTVHYFSAAAGQVTARWLWSPGSAEAVEAADEPARAATPGLHACYPYMLLSGVSGEIEVHLSMPEAGHTDLTTVRIPEALDETETVTSTATAGGLPWRRPRRLLEPGVIFAASAGVSQEAGGGDDSAGPTPGTVATVSRGSCIVQVRPAAAVPRAKRLWPRMRHTHECRRGGI